MNTWIFIKNSDFNKELTGFEKIARDPVNLYFKRDDRFAGDQIFQLDGNRIIVSDGVVLNLCELKEEFNCKNLKEYIDKNPDTYYENFVGPFCGVIYDELNDRVTAYGNQTGDSPIFYYSSGHIHVISNDMNLIVLFLKNNGIQYTLDQQAARYIMSFGYMIDDSTWIQEIKRLEPGKRINILRDSITIDNYFQLSFEEKKISEDEALERIDDSFRKAVKRCFDKDLEYGYPYHLADISGGLDSRLINFVARDLGYKDIVNISYSQSRSNEQYYAENISKYLGNVLLFEQLDDVSFLYEIDKMVEMEHGLAPYFGITGGLELLRSLNMSQFGLEHTGQLGDVILGTYLNEDTPIEAPVKRYSDILDVKIPADIRNKYGSYEEFLIRTRGFLGMLSTHLMRRHYTYAVCPFLDVEFLQLCMSIPAEMRRNHKLYWKYIDRYYPEIAKLPSTRIRAGLSNNSLKELVKRKAKGGINRLLYYTGLKKSRVSANNMNPIQYWYDTNDKLRLFIKDYHDNNIKMINAYPEMVEDIEQLYQSHNASDKLLALSAMATICLYFER